VNLSLEIQLDANHQGGCLVLAVIVNRPAQKLAFLQRQQRKIRGGWKQHSPAGWDNPDEVGSFRDDDDEY